MKTSIQIEKLSQMSKNPHNKKLLTELLKLYKKYSTQFGDSDNFGKNGAEVLHNEFCRLNRIIENNISICETVNSLYHINAQHTILKNAFEKTMRRLYELNDMRFLYKPI